MSAEVILIDDSDSDNDEKVPPKKASRFAASTTTNAVVNMFDDIDSDDESFQQQLKRAKEASLARTTTTTTRPGKKKTSKRVSLSQNSTTRENDSDSDDSLLNFQGLVVKTPAKKVATAHSETTATPRNNVAPPSASSFRSSTKSTTPMVNSYSTKKKSPGSASVTKRNPYSSTKKKVAPTASAHTASSAIISDNNPGATLEFGKSSDAAFPTADSFPYPALLQKSKQYPDLRAKYLLAFWKHARSLTLGSHNHQKLDQIIAKVVTLSLMPYPLRSQHEFCVQGSLQEHKHRVDALELQLKAGKVETFNVPVGVSRGGRYCSISEALLVAMTTEVDRRRSSPGAAASSCSQLSLSEQLASKEMQIPFAFLIPEIEKRLHSICPGRMQRKKDPDGGLAYYLDKSTRSAEMLQIRKLENTCKAHTILRDLKMNNGQEGYIKFRSAKKQVVLELLPLGYRTAQWVKKRAFPAPVGYFRTSRIASLDHVDPIYSGTCLAVDSREGGHSTPNVLQKMCSKLDMVKVPYFVGALDIGDYAFFCIRPGSPDHRKLCPVLIERKSIQDVAGSIADGRWVSQKQRMYHGQYVFGYNNCRMAYLIEGKKETQQVSGGYIGHRKYDVDRERLDAAIDNLESEGFDVLRSTSPENSMFELARWATRVAEEVRSGKLVMQYTFEEFKAEVKKIPKEADFSRIAKDHMEIRLERKRQAAASAVERAPEGGEDLDRKPAAKPRRLKVLAPSRPSAVDAIDLCSDDDDDATKERVSSKENKRRPSNSNGMQRKVPPKKKNPMLKDSSVLRANAVRSEHLLLPSPEVASYFGNDNDTDDSDDNETDDELLSRVNKTVAKSRKQQKRKRESLEKAQPKAKKAPKTTSTPRNDKKTDSKKSSKPSTAGCEFEDWSGAQLKAKCEELGLSKTGKRSELIERLGGPRPPSIWLERTKNGHYAPRYNTGAAALLVALYLHERDQNDGGMTKDALYAKAEGLEISKNKFSGGTTQTGPYLYDGWSSMTKLKEGEIPLVLQKKHALYRLTRSGHLSGYNLAKAMHTWCKEHKCGHL